MRARVEPDTNSGAGERQNTDERFFPANAVAVVKKPDGQQFRLTGQRLFRVEPLSLSWGGDADNRAFSRLGLSHEGQLLKTPSSFEDRDARQQLHSVPLSDANDLRPQWNLSDVLVKGIEP
ncbi:hypothetical protein [Pseudomonas sp. TWR1-1-4]|uniref:hypothetical protein n=1 Tax=Pseudomonas sp. TWR1-1-4 TaxID=2804604 RepID=UPI003CF30850